MEDKDQADGQAAVNEQTATDPANPGNEQAQDPGQPGAPTPNVPDAQAEDPTPEPEPEDKPHPAIAQIEGAGVTKGTVIDISGANHGELPVGVVVADKLGRVYRHDEDETGNNLVYLGHLV